MRFPQAFRGEFAVFSPLPGCFEHFGLDFMVDEDFHVWLLEANPGPDFKQVCLFLGGGACMRAAASCSDSSPVSRVRVIAIWLGVSPCGLGAKNSA